MLHMWIVPFHTAFCFMDIPVTFLLPCPYDDFFFLSYLFALSVHQFCVPFCSKAFFTVSHPPTSSWPGNSLGLLHSRPPGTVFCSPESVHRLCNPVAFCASREDATGLVLFLGCSHLGRAAQGPEHPLGSSGTGLRVTPQARENLLRGTTDFLQPPHVPQFVHFLAWLPADADGVPVWKIRYRGHAYPSALLFRKLQSKLSFFGLKISYDLNFKNVI